ncbi:Auxin-induced protein like [Actinidia chinensis var. chinensis]|uniref:Auxin-induced protein like n=1 Tax=Actinidia chinensis var. chinensis TaxID=1590841 RepID=A0A2R6QHR6_ACTCC|nr:Auxin-induced protein like [Actinidia chinensis var. chinensis]
MRPSLLVSFLFLSIFISEVQGIRLKKGFFANIGYHKIHEEAIQCKEGQCSGNNIRKLVEKATSTIPTTTTIISKNEKNGGPKVWSNPEGKLNTKRQSGKEESLTVSSPPVSEHREAINQRYPDILDLAGMDYTPARRKPPIHN